MTVTNEIKQATELEVTDIEILAHPNRTVECDYPDVSYEHYVIIDMLHRGYLDYDVLNFFKTSITQVTSGHYYITPEALETVIQRTWIIRELLDKLQAKYGRSPWKAGDYRKLYIKTTNRNDARESTIPVGVPVYYVKKDSIDLVRTSLEVIKEYFPEKYNDAVLVQKVAHTKSASVEPSTIDSLAGF